MSGDFKTSTWDNSSQDERGYNFGGAPLSDETLVKVAVGLHGEMRAHGTAIAAHEGAIKGLQSAISAVQSSLGAWLSVAGVVTAVLLGLAVFNLTRTNAVGDSVQAQSQRIGGVEVKLGTVDNRAARIEDQLDVLPEQVARELRRQEASVAIAPQE